MNFVRWGIVWELQGVQGGYMGAMLHEYGIHSKGMKQIVRDQEGATGEIHEWL